MYDVIAHYNGVIARLRERYPSPKGLRVLDGKIELDEASGKYTLRTDAGQKGVLVYVSDASGRPILFKDSEAAITVYGDMCVEGGFIPT